MKKYIFISLIISALCISCAERPLEYHLFEGPVFGTSFRIWYEYDENKDLEDEILTGMRDFDMSLSTYNPESIISRINSNVDDVELDSYFRTVINRANQISEKTDGAFDITVAPLVNAYGFGFTAKDTGRVSDSRIEDLLSITGYEKIRIRDDRLEKDDPRVMLDVSAIAKGYSVDVVSMILEENGVKNYLVEIGGEARCVGVNSKGVRWRIGIDKPIESMTVREIQIVLNLSGISMATSGNYRQFYIEDDVKYSHTIDPKIGKPVRHYLLSATVLAPDCMTADAYATAFMVLGLENSLKIVNSNPELEAYFIYNDQTGDFKTTYTDGLEGVLEDSY